MSIRVFIYNRMLKALCDGGGAPCRTIECYLQPRKNQVGRESASDVVASTLSAVRVLYPVASGILSAVRVFHPIISGTLTAVVVLLTDVADILLAVTMLAQKEEILCRP